MLNICNVQMPVYKNKQVYFIKQEDQKKKEKVNLESGLYLYNVQRTNTNSSRLYFTYF